MNQEDDTMNTVPSLNSKPLIAIPDLIEMVKSKPGLWDKNSTEYRNANRVKLWYELCEEMIPDFANLNKTAKYEIVRQLTKKWYNTRDSYRKSLRTKKSKPYIYSELLTFLNPVMTKRNNKHEANDINDEDTVHFNFDEKSDGEDYEEVYLEGDETTKKGIKTENKSQEVYIEAEDYIDATDVTPAKLFKPGFSKDNPWSIERQNISTPRDDKLLPIIHNIIQREDDEDRAFFNSLIPTVKSLSHQDKLEFRIQVLTALKKFNVNKEKDPIESFDSD